MVRIVTTGIWKLTLSPKYNYQTPYSRDLPDKLTLPQSVKKLSALYETWRLITAFLKIHFNIITPIHACIFLVVSSPQVSPPKSSTHLSSPPSTRATCTAYFILLDLISRKIFGEEYMSLICDKSGTTQNLAFLSHWYRKKRFQMHF